jgi:hypothetical protein
MLTISRLRYLKTARHRGGHQIHSPFLFRLITTVIEDNKKQPEYQTFKILRKEACESLRDNNDPIIGSIFANANIDKQKYKKLYRQIELPERYLNLIFRLIREFKPSSIISYGPTLGVHLGVMAIANPAIKVYQSIESTELKLFAENLLKQSNLTNIEYLAHDSAAPEDPGLILINDPNHPQRTANSFKKHTQGSHLPHVIIVRGIHTSKEMEKIWTQITEDKNVQITLDHFETGLVLLKKGLQKENFTHRF